MSFLKFFPSLLSKLSWENIVDQLIKSRLVTRRSFSRINYPPSGPLGELPKVIYNETPLKPINLSLGGICVQVPPQFNLEKKIGVHHKLIFSWPYNSIQFVQSCETVKVEPPLWYFKFHYLDPKILTQIITSFKPAKRAQTLVMIYPTSLDELAEELEQWKSPAGDSIVFLSMNKKKPYAEADIQYRQKKFRYKFNDTFAMQASSGNVFTSTVSLELLEEIIIFLFNIIEPSRDIKSLANKLDILRQRQASPSLTNRLKPNQEEK